MKSGWFHRRNYTVYLATSSGSSVDFPGAGR